MTAPTRLLVDAANVVGARPDGWWRDRAAAGARLHARLAAWVAAGGAEQVVVVLEGRARAGAPAGVVPAGHGSVEVVHAPGSGDDTLVQLGGPGWCAVTADRALAERLRAAGSELRGPGWLWARLDEVAAG